MINEEKINSIRQGYYSAFIDGSTTSSLAFKPEFVSNNYREGKKVISTVEAELLHCEEFCISVAFITMGGITPLLQTFKELEDRGISGKILTTNYLNFSQPEALEKLHALSNIELRMYMSAEDEGFHTKGYIFRDQDLTDGEKCYLSKECNDRYIREMCEAIEQYWQENQDVYNRLY